MGSISWWTFSYELWKFWSHQSQERRIKMTVLRGGLTFWLRAVSGPPLAHHFLFRNQPVTSLWLRPSFIAAWKRLKIDSVCDVHAEAPPTRLIGEQCGNQLLDASLIWCVCLCLFSQWKCWEEDGKRGSSSRGRRRQRGSVCGGAPQRASRSRAGTRRWDGTYSQSLFVNKVVGRRKCV